MFTRCTRGKFRPQSLGTKCTALTQERLLKGNVIRRVLSTTVETSFVLILSMSLSINTGSICFFLLFNFFFMHLEVVQKLADEITID